MTAYAVLENPTSFTGLGVWRYRTETAPPPASGQIRFDNADISLATEFYLNETNDDGSDVSTFIDLLMTEGSTLYIQDRTDADKFVLLELGTSVDNGVYRTFQIASLIEGSGGEPAQNTQVALIITSGSLVNGVIAIGTPVNDEIAIWTGPNSVEGDPDFTWSGDLFNLVWQDPGSVLNNTGIGMLNDSSVLNTDGWQIVVGSPGLFDGELLFAADITDTVNSLRMRLMPNNNVVFVLGAGVSENFAFRAEAAGALTFFMPQDTTGREETKISFVGEVGGTGHEGVFSIEGFAYGNTGLQFHRLFQCVIDADYTLHMDAYGRITIGNVTSLPALVVAGDNASMGYSAENGLELTGQGTTNDVTIFNDANVIVAHILTGTTDWIFDGSVGVGNVAPTAQLHIDQFDAAGAKPVVRLDQGDIDDTFIDFIGTSAADGTRSISSDTTEDSAKFGAIRVEINGVTKWIRIYDDES